MGGHKPRKATQARADDKRSVRQRCPRCKKLRARWLRANAWNAERQAWERIEPGKSKVCHICVQNWKAHVNIPWKTDSKQTSYEATIGSLRVIIHRHIDNPGKWHVTCFELDVQHRELKASDTNDAKGEGITYLKSRVRSYAEYLNSVG